jgi:HK97 family phage prohead protease
MSELLKRAKINDFVRRSYSFDIRAESIRAENTERGNIITGRPIVYNSRTNIGPFDEIIDSGALDGADLRDVRFLVNHDLSKIPLARSRRNNGNSTMQLNPDSMGLELWVELDTENNAEARALYSAVERGDISGMSFLFSVDSETWDDLESDHPTRHITKFGSIIEISAVTFPAYQQTEINARNCEALDSARAALENARQSRAAAVDTAEIDLAKAKTKTLIMGGKK